MNLGLQLTFVIIIGFAGFSQATSVNVLAHWSLNGSEPGLTLHGGPTFVEGRYPGSKAINLNQPSNCFARIPKVELRGRSFTIALWVKVNSILADREQLVFGDWYSPWQFFIEVKNTGTIHFVRHSTDASWYALSLSSTSRIDVGKWFHIAVTWDQSGGVSKLYIDAKQNNTLAIDKSKTWQPPTRDTYMIGNGGPSEEVKLLGSAMDLYIIDGVLNSEQINHLRGVNVLAHWSLNGSEPGLTLHGGPTFVEGRYPGSKAINFNQPSNCFARIPKVELRGRSFTIALWVKVNSILTDREQLVFGDWYSPWQFFIEVKNTGTIHFVRHSTDASWYALSLSSTSRIDVGKWFHIAVTWDQSGGVSKLYIDAKENNTLAIDKSKKWQPPRATYEIGDDGHSDEHQFLGSVMDLYIIDGVLNSEQINQLRGFLVITSSYLNNTFVFTNETVKCQAKGSPTPNVAWVRSGVVLVNKTSTAEITITENNGEYVCVVSNKEGTKNITVTAKASLQLCHDHLTITDVSRAANYISQSSQVKNDNTDIDFSKWYRIQSPAGNQLPTTCVPQNRCGTQAPGWLNSAHPSIQDGIVKRIICFHLNGDCCYQNTTVHIRKCFGYYVYKFSGVPEGLPGRYCIENQQHDNQDHPDTVFQAIDEEAGSRLIGHVIYTEADVQVVFVCMSYCQLYSGCKSFNFHREKKICELNNATQREQPDAFQKKISSVTYYEKIEITRV